MRTVIAVDIGGTNTRLAIVDENLTILKKTSFKTNTLDPVDFLTKLNEFINESNQQISSIGVSFPGPLDTKNGKVLTPPNLPGWHYYPIVEKIEGITGLTCRLEGDARCAGLAEACSGAAIGSKTVFYITISTGVGASIIHDNHIYNGDNGFAGEIPNSILWPNGPQMGELQAGSIECIASGTGILKRAQDYGLMANTTKEVFEYYKKRDIIAVKIINEVIDYVSNYLAIIQTTVDPSMIILGGSVITNNEWLINELSSSIKKKIYPDFRSKVNVTVSKYKDDAGIIGAAILATQIY